MKAALTFHFAQIGNLAVYFLQPGLYSTGSRKMQRNNQNHEPALNCTSLDLDLGFQPKREKMLFRQVQKRNHLFPLGITILKQIQFH